VDAAGNAFQRTFGGSLSDAIVTKLIQIDE